MNLSQTITICEKYIRKNFWGIFSNVSVFPDETLDVGEGFIHFAPSIKAKNAFIGISNISDFNNLSDAEIILLCKSILHENYHLAQKFKVFPKPSNSHLDISMAEEVLFCRGNKGLYDFMYKDLKHEICAEYMALKDLPRMLSELFPSINFDVEIRKIFKEIAKDEGLFSFVKLSGNETYNEVLSKIKTRLNGKINKSFDSEAINKISTIRYGERDALLRFLDYKSINKEFEMLFNSSSASEQNLLLISTNVLAMNTNLVSLERRQDFNIMFNNYKILNNRRRSEIEKCINTSLDNLFTKKREITFEFDR